MSVTPYDTRRKAARYGGAIATYKRLTQAAESLTKQMKSRGIYPKTRLERKMLPDRQGRKIPATRLAVKSPVSGGDYSQFTFAKMKTGYKRKTTLRSLTRELHGKNETSIFRFGAMNPFNDNGFFFCGKNRLTVANRTDLPLYMFDLTSLNNTGSGGAAVTAVPFQRAYIDSAAGFIGWSDVAGENPDGSTVTNTWINEKLASTATGIYKPHEKSRLLWTDLRLNLWGAKNKAVKYTIQLVKLNDQALDPRRASALDAGTDDYKKHSAFYQGLIKPYTFNPLSLTSVSKISRYMKVLKTYTTVIQPTSSSENDSDPHVKSLKWFMRWDRDLSYIGTALYLTSATELNEDGDYAYQNSENSAYVLPRQKIFLMIRATAYQEQVDAGVDNTVSPSFDMTVRACHVTQ